MESNDTASGMPYMAYIRHKKEYVNIPAGLTDVRIV